MDVISVSGSPVGSGLRLVGGDTAKGVEVGVRGMEGGTPMNEMKEESASSGLVEKAVSTIEAFTQSISRNLSFKLDDSTGRVVVTVSDTASGEVIRQIPSEEALRLAESLEEARSLLFKAEA
ncbi:hypothetical protein Pres01_19640 [Metapseudomonas resinovorans]|uniref:flagellar protein FlaG n=1 Tax=Metapseudomonas resinovorans TaxID=53412 RepID=UPI0018FE45A9|nr:flagellar protein FlaG [Pseudomonas resinovorans]GLZ85913.1 hypothetical protein Pres01_19640 [Pseudomonas resinovorans]